MNTSCYSRINNNMIHRFRGKRAQATFEIDFFCRMTNDLPLMETHPFIDTIVTFIIEMYFFCKL